MGDEGKGKIVDVLTSKYDIIARWTKCRTHTRI
jgi:adenylosuccinate synthase